MQMNEQNNRTTDRTKRPVEKSLMVIHVKREIIDILQITNRRFMYNPQTGILILGDEMFARLESVNGDTIVRGFCRLYEERLGRLLPDTLKKDA